MGEQFWWFYDAAIAAIILVAAFINSRKKLSRSITSCVAFMLGVFIASTASEGIARSVYENTIRSSNINRLNKALTDESFVDDTKIYIESLGYNVSVSSDKIEEIFTDGEDVYGKLCSCVNNANGRKVVEPEEFKSVMAEGFANIICKYADNTLNDYAQRKFTEAVINDPDKLNDFFPLTQEEFMKKAAAYLENTFMYQPYTEMTKLMVFVALMLVLIIVVKLMGYLMFDKLSESDYIGTGEHIAGAVMGIIIGAVIILAGALIVRACAAFGKNDMIFFNENTINKTYVFKYFYKFSLNF